MNPLFARIIYCVGLCFLAACAVLPDKPVVAAASPALSISVAPTVAQQLAAATRDRVEAERRYGANHPAVLKAVAVETTLRAYAGKAEPQDFHRQLIDALSNELAAALAQRAEASVRYGVKHPQMQEAELLVQELTVALNLEVRTHS